MTIRWNFPENSPVNELYSWRLFCHCLQCQSPHGGRVTSQLRKADLFGGKIWQIYWALVGTTTYVDHPGNAVITVTRRGNEKRQEMF